MLNQDYEVDSLIIDRLIEDLPTPPNLDDLIHLAEDKTLDDFSVIFNYLLTDLKALLYNREEIEAVEHLNTITQSFNSTFLISQNLQFKAAGLCFLDQLFDFFLNEDSELSQAEVAKRAL
jgi:hypothetical protein